MLDTNDSLKLERRNLKDRAAQLVRDYIIIGRISAGAKLTESGIADLLGVSRAPARDALMQLEREGLVVSKPDARYVIELRSKDVCQLYQVRTILEKAAVELAMQNLTDENKAGLMAAVQKMEEAITNQDQIAYTKSDVDMHRLIWELSGNPYLLKSLETMSGPIFMFVANNADKYDLLETLTLHQDLAAAIVSGDTARAAASLERHMGNSLERVMRLFEDAE